MRPRADVQSVRATVTQLTIKITNDGDIDMYLCMLCMGISMYAVFYISVVASAWGGDAHFNRRSCLLIAAKRVILRTYYSSA